VATTTVLPLAGTVTKFNITNPGKNYTIAPIVEVKEGTNTSASANAVLSPTLGIGAQVAISATGGNVQSLNIMPLTEQELFDNRGRYNYTGGVEMPFTNAVNQTTVPLNYIDAATESIADGETQVWKITVNGLFSNNLSFNLADVQLINRVGWDGTVKPPSSNEVGWKSTVRMNPLEDVLVAVKAKRAKVPFGLPKSSRVQDPSKKEGALGSEMGFTVGQGVPQLIGPNNRLMPYDNEFFWGSALLSNAENDFTRTIVFQPTVVKPDAPTNLTDPMGDGTLTWTDPTPAGVATTLANPKNEIGFKILKASFVDSKWIYTPFLIGGVQATVPANTTSWKQPDTDVGNTAFAVVAYNAVDESAPSTPFADAAPTAPSIFTAAATAYNAVKLEWSGNTTNNSIEIRRDGVLIKTLPGVATSFVDLTVTAQLTYSYTITVKNSLGFATADPVSATTPMMPVLAPTIVSALPNNAGTSTTLRWTDNATNETVYWVDVSMNGGLPTRTTLTRNAAQATQVGGALNTLIATVPGNVYTLSVTAVNVSFGATNTSPPATTTVDLSVQVLAAPATLTPQGQTATRAPFNWAAVAAPVTTPATTVSYVVQVNTNGAGWSTLATTNATSANPAIAAGNSYQFQVLTRATRFNTSTLSTTPSTALSVVTPPAASTALVATAAGSNKITLTLNNPSSNIDSWKVERRPNFGANNLRVYSTITPTVTGTTLSYTFIDDTVPSLVTGANNSYTYRVTAVNAKGNGPVATSNPVTAQ
jgi:hypothetical protein